MFRRQLTRFAMKLAERDPFRWSRGILGGKAVEQMEDNGKTAGSDDGENSRPSSGELALRSLDMALLDGPLAVEPPDEPVPGSGETDY